MRYQREKSQCHACPLRDRTRVWATHPEHPTLMIIGEAPGREEDNIGKPFVGASGKFFTYALSRAGIIRDAAWITNTLSCRPPSNSITSPEAVSAASKCTPGFWEEFAEAKRRGIQTVVTLGATATKMFGIHEPMSKIRGSVYPTHGVVVIPTYHPAYLLRMGYNRAGAKVDLTSVWFADLAKAARLASDGWTPPIERFNIFPTVSDVKDFFATLAPDTLLGVDIETRGGKNPGYTEIVCIGFASSSEEALVVPLIVSGHIPYWGPKNRPLIDKLLNEVFQRFPLMFQNALYDVPILARAGYDIDMSRVVHDTMLLHHAIATDMPHRLDFITSIYGTTPYWKDTLKGSAGDILDIPDADRHTYNARDCVVMHQILPPMLEDLDETGTRWVYEKISLPMLAPVAAMCQTGMLLDRNRLRRLKKELTEALVDHETHLRTIASLPEAFNISSDDELRWLLFGLRPAKFDRLSKLSEYTPVEQKRLRCLECGSTRWYIATKVPVACPKCGASSTFMLMGTRMRARKSRDTAAYRELLQIKEVAGVTPLYMPPTFRGRRTDTGKLSVAAEGRLSLRLAAQNRLDTITNSKRGPNPDELADILRLLEFLSTYEQFAVTEKILSTYTTYTTWSDGRVHPDVLIHGTGTGRLACRNPNLMNLPKKMKTVREIFVAPPDHVLISRDYTNLEVFILAYLINDADLIDFLLSGGNIHDKNTRELFNLTPADERWSLARRAAKIFQFGGIQYGGGDQEIHRKIVQEVPDLNLTLAQYKTARSRWMNAHPAYVRWANQVKALARSERVSRTALGRVRTLLGATHDIEKQAMNTPIQGTAADIINLATIRIHDRFAHELPVARLVMQIHDELLVECPTSFARKASVIMREEMNKPVIIHGIERQFFTSEAIGSSWGTLKEQGTTT